MSGLSVLLEMFPGRMNRTMNHPILAVLASLAIALSLIMPACCDQNEPAPADITETDADSSSPGKESADASPSKEIPGFTFLKEETFSCGDQTHTVRIFVHDRTELEFVLVKGGTFTMGLPEGLRRPQPIEAPFHEVTVPSFLICRTELPQSAWDKITVEMKEAEWSDEREWTGPTYPIECVNWYDATAWCKAVGLRLPSEAEWEYACRSGSTTDYCYGDGTGDDEEDNVMADYGWIDINSANRSRAVALKKPNAFGIYDMHGNVWEWCQDVFQDKYEGTPTDGSAHVGDDENRIFRGGGFPRRAKYCKSALRYRCPATERDKFIGFRPACSLPENFDWGD